MLLLKDVLPHFENNKAALAVALGITRQAVSQWGEDEPIPENHELKLRYEILPGAFGQARATKRHKKFKAH